MEYIYAAMLLHKAGQKVDEASLNKVLEAAGSKPDTAQAKAVVAALDGVDIEQAIKDAAVAPVAAPAVSAGAEQPAKEDKKKSAEEEKKGEEQAAAGLGALFG